jgi:hypothetical protein
MKKVHIVIIVLIFVVALTIKIAINFQEEKFKFYSENCTIIETEDAFHGEITDFMHEHGTFYFALNDSIYLKFHIKGNGFNFNNKSILFYFFKNVNFIKKPDNDTLFLIDNKNNKSFFILNK